MNVLRGGSKLEWYVRRLQVMGPAEIGHRSAEALRRAAYRRRAPHPELTPRSLRTPELLTPLLGRLAEIPGTKAHWHASSTQLATGTITLLGQTWSAHPIPNWQLDPGSGREWPRRYAFDIDYRQTEQAEAKYVWELNRLGYLLAAAGHVVTTHDPQATTVVKSHIQDWIRRNRPYEGVAWASGIEVALRIITLIVVDEVVAAEEFDVDFLEHVHASVLEHVDWLSRFPSRHSSANNHRVAELCGLLVAAAKYSTIAARLNTGRLTDELDQIADAQYYSDGIGAEQSNTYAAFSLEWLAITAAALDATGQGTSSHLDATMRRAASALDVMTDIGGNVVRFGDDDEGRVLTAALPFDQFFAGVRRLLPVTVLADPTRHELVQADAVHVFPDGGYSVARTSEHGQEVLWVMDHGPLGFGEIAAHGHADALAVWLHVAGRPVFVDAGTYLYHSGGDWREFMRTTAAHNTVMFEGLSSSVTAGNFNWRHNRRARARMISHRNGPYWRVEAEHDGYAAALGVVHHRLVERVGHGHFRISDSASHGPEVSARWSMLLAPDLRTESQSDGWVIWREDRMLARLVVSPGFSRSVLRGSNSPLAGWHSARFGHLEPTDQLLLSGTLGASHELKVDIHLADPSQRTSAPL